MLKDFIVFSVISYILLEMLPKAEYKKNVSVFIGICTLIIFFRPVIEFFHNETTLEKMISDIEFDNDINDTNIIFEEFDAKLEQSIVNDYIDDIKEQINIFVVNAGFCANEIIIYTDEQLQLTGIDLSLSKKYYSDNNKIKEIVMEKTKDEDEIDIINLKNTISEFYNLNINNINVSK